MNAYDTAPKGEAYEHPLIRVETNRPGYEGIGAGLYSKPDEEFFMAAKSLIGVDPLELLQMKSDHVAGPGSRLQRVLSKYPFLDASLFDLVGKLLDKPVWQLLGRKVRERVPAYDGTLYFADVLHPERGVEAVVDECRESVAAGYRGLKLKLGRNWKWMPGEAGRTRDLQVVRAVRNALGSKVMIMGDANNGYKGAFEQGWNLVNETARDGLHWIEELFPESVAGYTRLKDKMMMARIETLCADGENFSRPDEFAPYLRPRRLMDILQLDIRRGGFLGIREVARLGEAAGAQTIPHNWASQIGVLMALHLASVTPSIPMVEDDRSRFPVLSVKGYEFHDGSYTVSNEPGLGIQIERGIYRDECEAGERVIS